MFFFFNDTATTEIYTLSLHDALPICVRWCCGASSARAGCGGPRRRRWSRCGRAGCGTTSPGRRGRRGPGRSEEHTSELQSQSNLVCRLLLEKKKRRHYADRCEEITRA